MVWRCSKHLESSIRTALVVFSRGSSPIAFHAARTISVVHLEVNLYSATFELEQSFDDALLRCQLFCLLQYFINTLYALQRREQLIIKRNLFRQELDIFFLFLQCLFSFILRLCLPNNRAC